METTMIDKAIRRLELHGMQLKDANGKLLPIVGILATIYAKASGFPPTLRESVDDLADVLIDTLHAPIDSGSDTGELLFSLLNRLS